MRHDVTFPLTSRSTAIFNLACPASPIHYQRDPVQATKTSVHHGTINMFGLAKRLGVRVLQASTSEVYGEPLVVPSRTNIGATSIRSAPTTKASVAPKLCSSTTGASTGSRSAASSMPTHRGCNPMTAASSSVKAGTGADGRQTHH
jgi:GDP-mannose 4,6 dehydratase